jgi:S1-C subfamily serine protease
MKVSCTIQNFDMSNFGVISPKLKSLASTLRITLPVTNFIDSLSSTVEWQGWNVKNLETLGERSATGMDTERGVLVIFIVRNDSQMKDILHDNDVILNINGKVINNLADLQNATSQADMSKQLEIVVCRNQKENIVLIPANKVRK